MEETTNTQEPFESIIEITNLLPRHANKIRDIAKQCGCRTVKTHGTQGMMKISLSFDSFEKQRAFKTAAFEYLKKAA